MLSKRQGQNIDRSNAAFIGLINFILRKLKKIRSRQCSGRAMASSTNDPGLNLLGTVLFLFGHSSLPNLFNFINVFGSATPVPLDLFQKVDYISIKSINLNNDLFVKLL